MYIKQSGTVKWFGHEPFQNGDHGDYIYVCKICYYHDIVEELKNNNHYYVSHAITFHIVLSKERWTFFYLLTSLDIAEYECHINCLTIETSRRMHLADMILLLSWEPNSSWFFCGVRVSEFVISCIYLSIIIQTPVKHSTICCCFNSLKYGGM